MRSAWFRRLGLAAVAGWLAIAGTAATSGCAGTREDINRVQPNAIRKSDLVGDFRNPKDAPDFYMRSLILAVQRTNPWFSDGLQDLTRRVRFEITEDYLIVRNAYEYIANSDGKGGGWSKANNGLPVAMYPITSHFNVQRAYNPVTGEEMNVIEENSSDRPWYEREYMRVDWSRNLINDPNQIFFGEANAGELDWQPVAFYENDPNKFDASNLSELGDGYFDITSKWLAKPASFDYYGYQVPQCLLQNMNLYPSAYNADGSIECNAQEVTLRTSFNKVPTGDQATDYETAEISPWQGNIMGNLTLSRSGYDRSYGVVDQTWHTFIMRYNIWQKSHTAQTCGENEVKADGDATCAGSNPNSVCDMNAKLCTIPYTDRTVRPIAWFVDPDMPAALYPNAQRSIGEWNMALRRGVSYAREAECRRAGGDRDGCHAKFFKGAIDPKQEDVPSDDLPDINVMCHNPVQKGDNAACGQEGLKVRKGDIRHHMIAWWDNPSFERPLGVVVWSGDPINGENIGSIVNIFGASVETYSAYARDQLQLINGDFTPAEYAAGVPRQIYDDGRTYDTDPVKDPVLDSMSSKFQALPKGMSAKEIDARIKAVDVVGLQKKYGWSGAAAAAMSPAERMKNWASFVNSQSSMGTPGFTSPETYVAKINKRLGLLQKGGFESKLMSQDWIASQGADPSLAGNPAVAANLSPLQGENPTTMALQGYAKIEADRKRHMCALDLPEMLRFNWEAGYAAKLKARYPDGAVASGDIAKKAGVEGQKIDRVVRGKLIYQELQAPMYEFTLLHEMGHLMSMEHDFSGSWDSPNYYPEYWILRANPTPSCVAAIQAGKPGDASCKQNMVACDAPRADGAPDTCMGPRWLDPATTDEVGTTKGKEHDSADSYAVSSVMDYKFDSLYAAKLGLFDKMAAKYIYTGLVETFDDDKNSLIKNAHGTGVKYMPTLTILNSERWIVGTNYAHYTDMGRQLNLFDPGRCRAQTDEEKAAGIGQMGIVCAPVHKDHAFLRDMKDDLPKGGFPEDFRVQFAREKTTSEGGYAPDTTTAKYRWPYKAGDGGTAYVHQAVYDNGADFYEVTADILERYELMYLDYFYRKGSREPGRGLSGPASRIFGRFFERVQQLQWNALSDVVRNGSVSTEGADPESAARVLSLTMLFEGMQKALLRPEPGAYVKQGNTGLFDLYGTPQADGAKGDFSLGAGDARYVDSKFDASKQYDFLAYSVRSGTFIEKPLASIALTDSRPQLSTVARETYLDGRNVYFSFRSAIPAAFDHLVAGVMADDWDTVAPYIDPSSKADEFGMSPLKSVDLIGTSGSTWSPSTPRPAGSKLVDPMLGYRVKIPTAVLMLLYQPVDTNMELVNKTRVWIKGAVEEINIPDSEKVVFFDPVDGVEWNSKSFGKTNLLGKIVDEGIGARMMEHANELLMAAFNVETETVPGSTTQLRVKYGADNRPMKKGGGTLTADDVKDNVAADKLRDYVAFLNQVRTAYYYLGFGPVGYED